MMTGINEIDVSLLNPAIWFIAGGILTLFAPEAYRRLVMLVSIFAGFMALLYLNSHDFTIKLFLVGYQINPLNLDNLSFPFVIVFHIAAFLNTIWGWHDKDRLHCCAGLIYPAAAIGGVLAGDFLTLFIFWEITAIASAFFIWGAGTFTSIAASLRYLLIQIFSGVMLLIAVVFVISETGSAMISKEVLFAVDGSLTRSGLILLIAIGIKSAFPLLHNWVQDAYPKATMGGTILLSIFTTKLAVYLLARLYVGYSPLLVFGAIMTIFPIFFALIENDLKKVLCYSINNQVGFMVIGIGIGTALSVNGAVGYAFCNIIFESLLFMVVGAVVYRTGTSKATELGGLYKTMPITLGLCLIGALSISAFPFFSGFVTKGLIISQAGAMNNIILWSVLLFASAGVLEHAGIKIPYFIFFAHDSKKTPNESPPHMLVAMSIAAILSIIIGICPDLLYNILPFSEELSDYSPYSASHIVEQLQLLFFAVLAFAVLIIFKWYPKEVKAENLDTDWIYRVMGKRFIIWLINIIPLMWRYLLTIFKKEVVKIYNMIAYLGGPFGYFAKSHPTMSIALWVIVILFLSIFVLIFTL